MICKFWLANIFWLSERHKIRRCQMALIGCFTWCVGGCECLSQSQYTCCPVQTLRLQLTWILIVVGVFIKVTVQTFNTQLCERFTDHQRVSFRLIYLYHIYMKYNCTENIWSLSKNRSILPYYMLLFTKLSGSNSEKKKKWVINTQYKIYKYACI